MLQNMDVTQGVHKCPFDLSIIKSECMITAIRIISMYIIQIRNKLKESISLRPYLAEGSSTSFHVAQTILSLIAHQA
jgi:hypothetical protein